MLTLLNFLVHELISESFEYKSIRIRQKHNKEEEAFAFSSFPSSWIPFIN